MSTMIASPDTEPRLPAVKPAQPEPAALTVPELRFPRFYLIAPTDDGLRLSINDRVSMADKMYVVYRVEVVPPQIFTAWLQEIIAREQGNMLIAMALRPLGNRFALVEKWRAVNVLAEHGVVLSKYLFESMEVATVAKRALCGVQESEEASE